MIFLSLSIRQIGWSIFFDGSNKTVQFLSILGYYQTTNPEIFMIYSINQKHRLPSYEIRALPPKNELIRGYFRSHELVFVSKTTKFSVRNVVRKDKSNS